MNDAKIKQQIVEKITGSTNVLVTVSNDPSVDALSAAIALTVMLNKLAKHTTAIFSGAMPPAITFLDPAKTFESSIDGLRDFIIALDKEKADHLRYKVEGDSVKIFITPYKTTLSDADLEFSQGDYNVELVLALGVENQAHLDSALEAHGSILHDATVITISNQDGTSSLGSIDWRDNTASSLSEMLVGLSELLQAETPLIDGEVSTALLTGIVAETDRFSNPKTSAKVMTIAAQLMAAGADQQLIASKLQESHEIGVGATPTGNDSGYTQPLSALPQPVKEGLAIEHSEVTQPVVPSVLNSPVVPSAGGIASAYALDPTDEPVPAPILTPQPAPVVALLPAPAPIAGKIADAYALDPEEATIPAVAPAISAPLGGVPLAPAAIPVPTPLTEPTMPAIVPDVVTPLSTEPVSPPASAGGLTLTPPSEEVGKHSYLGGAPSFGAPVNSAVEPTAPQQSVDIFAHDSPPTESNRDEAARTDALAAVNASYSTPKPAPQGFPLAPGITLPPPPPLPDFGALPTPAVSTAPLTPLLEPAVDSPYALDALPQQPSQQPAILGDILASSAPVTSDPGQFKIPGQ